MKMWKRMAAMGYSDKEVHLLLDRAFAPEEETASAFFNEKETAPERRLEGKDEETDERVAGGSASDQSI